MKEFFSEKVDAENGEGAEEDGGKLESGDGVADQGNEKGLDIDEQTLAAEIGRIEEFISSGFDGVNGVNPVGGFVGIESDRDIFDIGKAYDEGEDENKQECPGSNKRGVFLFVHRRVL